MPYTNPIVGGTALIRKAINSPNFVTGVSGWSINADGTVEVNSGIFRGSIAVGTPLAGPGGEITGTLPAPIAAKYGATLSAVTSFTILMSTGDGSYHYEIVGLTVGGTPFPIWATGWVSNTGVVYEFMSSSLRGVGSMGNGYGAGRSNVADITTWQYGIGLGAAKVGANTFLVFDTNIFLGSGPTDVGALQVKLPATFSNLFIANDGATITGGATIDDLTITDKLTAQNLVAGNQIITPSGIGVPTSVAVVFPRAMPAGLTYGATLGINSAAAGAITDVRYSAITNTGMTLSGTRNAVTPFTVSYVAFGV